VLYLPDRIVRLRANQTDTTTQGYSTVEELANALGVVPVVALRNSDRILDEYGPSEIDDLKPLVDALNKSLADMVVTIEYVGRPRRWATGIELTEEPVLDDDGQPTGDMKKSTRPAGRSHRPRVQRATPLRPQGPGRRGRRPPGPQATPRVPPADR
jgi:Phage portal protein, SPP1 Gp6-like